MIPRQRRQALLIYGRSHGEPRSETFHRAPASLGEGGGGGKIQIAEFRTPAAFAPLSQKTLINATGYGARALFGDESVTPVRGQLAHAIPQTDIHYGLAYQSS